MFSVTRRRGLLTRASFMLASRLANGTLAIELWGNRSAEGAPIFNAQAFVEGFTGPGIYAIAAGRVSNSDATLAANYAPESGSTCPECGGTMEIEEVLDDAIKGSFLLTMPTGAPEQGLPPTTARATFVAARNSPPYDGLFSPFMLCVAEWTP